jgi:hypothetical protein
MWSEVAASPEGSNGLRVLRFPVDECSPELFIGMDDQGGRHLLLEYECDMDLPEDNHENLALISIIDDSSRYLAIRLENDYFSDLFDDLVDSVRSTLMSRASGPALSEDFVQLFMRWSHFFDNTQQGGLSDKALQGLIGELFYLMRLLGECNVKTVDDMLRAWVGPYHTRCDFELHDKHVEVKSVLNAASTVKISSEYQLEVEIGLGMELAVVFMEKDLMSGVSLRELVDELRGLTMKNYGDFSIIMERLSKHQLSASNIGDYDNKRFRFLSVDHYDASIDGFPKLVKSDLPAGVKSVSYKLKLGELSDYLISE